MLEGTTEKTKQGPRSLPQDREELSGEPDYLDSAPLLRNIKSNQTLSENEDSPIKKEVWAYYDSVVDGKTEVDEYNWVYYGAFRKKNDPIEQIPEQILSVLCCHYPDYYKKIDQKASIEKLLAPPLKLTTNPDPRYYRDYLKSKSSCGFYEIFMAMQEDLQEQILEIEGKLRKKLDEQLFKKNKFFKDYTIKLLEKRKKAAHIYLKAVKKAMNAFACQNGKPPRLTRKKPSKNFLNYIHIPEDQDDEIYLEVDDEHEKKKKAITFAQHRENKRIKKIEKEKQEKEQGRKATVIGWFYPFLRTVTAIFAACGILSTAAGIPLIPALSMDAWWQWAAMGGTASIILLTTFYSNFSLAKSSLNFFKDGWKLIWDSETEKPEEERRSKLFKVTKAVSVVILTAAVVSIYSFPFFTAVNQLHFGGDPSTYQIVGLVGAVLIGKMAVTIFMPKISDFISYMTKDGFKNVRNFLYEELIWPIKSNVEYGWIKVSANLSKILGVLSMVAVANFVTFASLTGCFTYSMGEIPGLSLSGNTNVYIIACGFIVLNAVVCFMLVYNTMHNATNSLPGKTPVTKRLTELDQCANFEFNSSIEMSHSWLRAWKVFDFTARLIGAAGGQLGTIVTGGASGNNFAEIALYAGANTSISAFQKVTAQEKISGSAEIGNQSTYRKFISENPSPNSNPEDETSSDIIRPSDLRNDAEDAKKEEMIDKQILEKGRGTPELVEGETGMEISPSDGVEGIAKTSPTPPSEDSPKGGRGAGDNRIPSDEKNGGLPLPLDHSSDEDEPVAELEGGESRQTPSPVS